MELTHSAYDSCQLCPRRCGAKRSDGRPGVCGSTAQLRIARAALHFWEEPPISGDAGSGAIFFSGCPLRCVFCQNHEISQEGQGTKIETERLAAIMLELQEQGALNINLVTPFHYAPHVREALLMARTAGLVLPIVCNTSGYERADVVRSMSDIVDIWLTDFKYGSPELAGRLSGAPDYPQVASDALRVMLESLCHRGGRRVDEQGTMVQGIIVRHLVLPGHADDSCAVIDRVWELAGNDVDLSIMNQYTPNERCRRLGGPLSHGISDEEYDLVVLHADEVGFEHLWWQEGGTVSESFVPSFDDTGVEGPSLSTMSST